MKESERNICFLLWPLYNRYALMPFSARKISNYKYNIIEELHNAVM